MKNTINKIVVIFLLTMTIFILLYINNFILNKDTQWLKTGYLVAHAFGVYNEQNYTNSLEAFNLNYNKGHRIFEVDFQFTEDKILIGLHDRTTPIDTFKEEQEKVKYTLLSFDEICDLMLKYPDIIIITDTKYHSNDDMQLKTFNYMKKIIEEKDSSLYKRIVVQVYNQSMYYLLKKNYKFQYYIYTLYATKDTNEEIIKFIEKENIKVVTMGEYRTRKDDFVKKLKDMGIYIFVHTINDIESAKQLMNNGIYGIYTDSIIYNDLEYNAKKRYKLFKYN